MNKEEFASRLEGDVRAKIEQILVTKGDGDRYLNYLDSFIVSTHVRNVFYSKLGEVPQPIEFALKSSELILAPSTLERIKKIKELVGIAGGIGGIVMIITGIGLALGWGASLIAAVITFFVGTSMLGPIGWIAGGVGVTAIAGCFAFSDDAAANSEKYLEVVKSTLTEALNETWDHHWEQLSKD